MYKTTEDAAAAAPAKDDEIEGLNEKLLELLTAHGATTPARPTASCRVRSLSGTNSDADADSPVEAGALRHSRMLRYKYDYAFLHHGSPMNPKHPPNWLPPIGVFWDIENCQVPKGRSAAAVAQVIRDTFFHGYREAEFIVVCDVQKENKQVIQELNDAQVNLIHVAATYKNAADEKLKQSIRRFADIHGSPACIILISSDINFAADLSDIRHRKKIHVILLHNENSSEALILCANEHFNFAELMESLPVRTPSKVPEYCDLLVSNLPQDKDSVSIKRRLKQLSDNCGGRVIWVAPNAATIRFSSQDSADRAQKRMYGEDVFDSKIVVEFLKLKENRAGKTQESNLAVDLVSETAVSSPIQMYGASASITGARSLPGTPHNHSSSPVTGPFSGWNGIHCPPVNAPPGIMPPPPMFVGRPFTSNGEVIYNRPYGEMPRAPSPAIWQVAAVNQQYARWDDQQQQYKIDKAKPFGKRNQVPQVRDCGPANGGGGRTPDGMRRIRVGHGPLAHPQEWIMPRPTFCPMPIPSGYNGNAFGQSNNFKRRSPSPMYGSQTMEQQRNGHQMQIRNTKSPSPYQNSNLQIHNPQVSRTSPYQHSETENTEVENFFNPINNQGSQGRDNGTLTPIELLVTNLDQSIEPKEIKRVLSLIFMEHVMVLNVSVFMQSDGNFAASVKVPSLPDAQYAISQLHRRKVGYKRIIIAYAQTGGPNPQLIRSQIVMLLQEVPGHKLPLFKFREMYESRFMISISMSEMSKMRDVCVISEEPDGRMVSLNPDHRNTPSPCLSNMSQQEGANLELPYCTIHSQKPWPEKGWAEQEMASLPNVIISLKTLGDHMQRLLTTHNGSLPLPSLPHCYEAEFKQRLEDDENGVPLEHLVSCLPYVDLKQGIGSVKYIIWVGTKTAEVSHEETKCVSPPLANHLTLFSRELVDLLKTAPHCQVLFNRFIPAYHHHFGRQCRVADYGFTKLIDLLEALTHTVQVMGEGNKRMVTLSHRAQVRRFTSDLLRVLKAQASKQIALSEFPAVYARVIDKPWNVVDYGVCEIDDILTEVSENTVVVRPFNDNDRMIAIPKREQTPEEIERTKQFAAEVVELLGHAPQCSMFFNKFVPSYHHHFGHQCRLSDYGFTKLIELFEAIPNVLKIEEVNGGERRLSLTEEVGIKVLGEQISKLVARCRGGLSLANVGQAFLRQFGYVLRPESFQCNSMTSLMEKLSNHVRLVQMSTGPVVILVDKSHLQQLGLQCRRVLMDHSHQRLPVKQFKTIYETYYGGPCDVNEMKNDLADVVTFTSIGDEQFVELTPLQRFACNLHRVMMHYGGKMHVSQFSAAYTNIIGGACQAGHYGYPSVEALLKALPCTVVLQETRHKKKQLMFLNKKLAAVGIQLPSMLSSPYGNRDSSNDSVGSNKSSRTSVNETSFGQDSREAWNDGISGCRDDWTRKNSGTTWTNSNEGHWSAPTTDTEEMGQEWPTEFSREDHGRRVTPDIGRCNETSYQLSKSDTMLDETANGDKSTRSSVWETPPKCYFPPESYPLVEMPPLTLPTWFNKVSDEVAADLVSPMKMLVSATANPLRPRTSPYFSSKRNMVIAPHPSELPLPSMISRIMSFSKTPQRVDNRGRDIEESESPKSHRVGGDMAKLGNSLEDASMTDSENFSNSESEVTDRVSSTPSKPLFTGKRRLAAQFNQPIDP